MYKVFHYDELLVVQKKTLPVFENITLEDLAKNYILHEGEVPMYCYVAIIKDGIINVLRDWLTGETGFYYSERFMEFYIEYWKSCYCIDN